MLKTNQLVYRAFCTSGFCYKLWLRIATVMQMSYYYYFEEYITFICKFNIDYI